MKTTSPTAIDFRRLPKTFKGLCEFHLPRPIHDEVDWDNAMEILDAMAGHKLNAEQTDYLETLSLLVGEYEDTHHEDTLPKADAKDILAFLCEAHDMTAADLGRLLGSREVGYRLLSGEREPSKAHLRVLCERFKVGPGVFLGI